MAAAAEKHKQSETGNDPLNFLSPFEGIALNRVAYHGRKSSMALPLSHGGVRLLSFGADYIRTKTKMLLLREQLSIVVTKTRSELSALPRGAHIEGVSRSAIIEALDKSLKTMENI